MVTPDVVSQDVDALRRLADYHSIPVLAVHAPCLLITQRVWGRDPWGKLIRAKEVAEQLGARVVVVHPPFRWQRDYARDFGTGLARMQHETDVVFAVENMFPLRARGAEVAPYAPTWNPVQMDYPNVTLDLSHAAVSGSDALAMADELGGRLAHVHLADGTGLAYRDEHLVPGRGTQPCATLLHRLTAAGYRGMVVLEVKTFRAPTQEARLADLAEALEFTRANLAGPAGRAGPAAASPNGTRPNEASGDGTSADGASARGASPTVAARMDPAQTASPSTAYYRISRGGDPPSPPIAASRRVAARRAHGCAAARLGATAGGTPRTPRERRLGGNTPAGRPASPTLGWT